MILRLAAVLVATAPCLAAAAGFVLALEGDWRVAGSARALAVGDEVPEGARIEARAPTPFSRIHVVDARSGAIRLVVKCASPGACAQPAVMAGIAEASPAPFTALLGQAMARLRRDPQRYAPTISRSEAPVGDAVLRLDAGGVDLAPAFARLPAGRYRIELRPLQEARAASAPAGLEWVPGGGARVGGTGAGMHELAVEAEDGGVGGRAWRAWVLVASAESIERLEPRWQEALALAAAWGAAVEPAARGAFLRAALETLAR